MDDEFEGVEHAVEHGGVDPESASLWDNEEALDALRAERQVKTEESYEQMTKRLFEEASPLAAQRIIHIAVKGANENTALAAARYITDKMYEGELGGAKPLWEKIVYEAVSQAELHANAERS